MAQQTFAHLHHFHSEPGGLWVDFKAQEMALALPVTFDFSLHLDFLALLIGQVTLASFDHREKQPDKALQGIRKGG